MTRILSCAATTVLCLAVVSGASPLFAASNVTQIIIPVPDADAVERRTVRYICGERTISADYINAGSISLALLHAEQETTVLANVTAASGAKYTGGPYTWWTKGEAATLYDLRNGENATGTECKAVR